MGRHHATKLERTMNAPAEKLVTDVKVLVTDIEELLKATAAQTGERITATRARVEAALMNARDTVTEQARHTAQATDQYVHRHPWQAGGIAAGVGLLIGLLLGKR
jgi:ElaB/YqjD/DUF883 family membrane-anchored ribosome-binding protein